VLKYFIKFALWYKRIIVNKKLKDELLNAIQGKKIEPKDQGKFPGAHS